MTDRILDLDENKSVLEDLESLEPELQLELMDAIECEKIKTTNDVRKWLYSEFANADSIQVAHGIVERTRNRLQGIGRRGKEYPIDRSKIEEGVIATKKRREQREEQKRRTEALKKEAADELGADFVEANPEFINLLIGGTFSDVSGYGVDLTIQIKAAKQSFLEINKGKRKIFDKYLLKIMVTALEKYRNRTLSASNTFLYMNAMMQAGGRGTSADGEKLGAELTRIATERGEMNVISELDLIWATCIASAELKKKTSGQ